MCGAGCVLTKDIDSAFVHHLEELQQIHSQESEGGRTDFIVRISTTKELPVLSAMPLKIVRSPHITFEQGFDLSLDNLSLT